MIPSLLSAALWTLFGLIGPFRFKTETKAQKRPGFAYYPTQSRNGNNPSSQYVHEIGGLRLDILTGAAVAWMIAVFVPFSEPILAAIAPIGIGFLVTAFMVNREVTDTAEHGAEIMHAEANTLHPDAQAWLDKQGFTTYGEGEVWRMVSDRHSTQRTKAQAVEGLARWRFVSRVILMLGRW